MNLVEYLNYLTFQGMCSVSLIPRLKLEKV